MIEIKNRYSGDVIYTARDAADVRAAVEAAGDVLRDADLRGANLRDANLRDTDLRGANLWGARWQGLQLNGLPSGAMLLVPQGEGVWRLTVGCWSGTVDELETLVAGEDWPEAEGEEQVLRRPGLEAVVALCRAHIAYTEAKSGKRGLDG